MSTLTRALAMLALAALLMGLLGCAVILGSDHVDHPALTAAVGVGLGCFGLFCFARARHLDR